MRGMYDWTSLTRSQNLKVFERLPDKLVELLPDEDAAQLSALWKVQVPVNNEISPCKPGKWRTAVLGLIGPHLCALQQPRLIYPMYTLK